MRKTVSLLTAVAMLSVSIPPVSVFAQDRVATASPAVSAAPISPVVLATLKAFPNGGQALTDRIRLLILQNNDLASDVARAIRANGLLTTAQREATEKGLAEALTRLGIVAQAPGTDKWCPQGFFQCPEGWAVLAALAAIGGLVAYEASQTVSPH
jgi:hypothetical protein